MGVLRTDELGEPRAVFTSPYQTVTGFENSEREMASS